MTRPIETSYVDPLDHIWLNAARQLGLRVRRDPIGYATTDGKGVLTIAPDEDLDADDCLAQIILHELCHALVQGEHSFTKPDWGLTNDDRGDGYAGDTVREEACLRVQATLLRRYGLRRLLAPTTDFRTYYDALPPDPLSGDADDPSRPLAHAALELAARGPFHKVLVGALEATATVHQALARLPDAAEQAGPAQAAQTAEIPLPAIWQRSPAPALHESGLPMHDGCFAAPARKTCATCAYATSPGTGKKGPWRCQRSGSETVAPRKVDPAARACALFQAPLDCQVCAACCRHAFDLVPIRSKAELVTARQPALVEQVGRELRMRRDKKLRRCAALQGPVAGPYGCSIYLDRPLTCRDFASGTKNCLDARRRVGLEF